jgi:hypothetical protein
VEHRARRTACVVALIGSIIVGMNATTLGRRPLGVTALGVFFGAGAIISFASEVSLLWPAGPLEPMWRINPRARAGFAAMGPWALVLLAAVCIACASSALGLWRGRRWGHRIAIAVLSINLVGVRRFFGKPSR